MRPAPLSPGLRLALDFAPLAAFFLGYRFFDLYVATGALIATTLVSLAVTYAKERRISPAPLISGVLVAVMGGITLWLKDETFIKMKPTIVNLIFAGVLLWGVYGLKRGLLKPLLAAAFQLTERGWLLLSRRWGFFFVFLAGLNELIWRNFPEAFWVNFKVFGMLTLTLAFTLAQMDLIKRFQADTLGSIDK